MSEPKDKSHDLLTALAVIFGTFIKFFVTVVGRGLSRKRIWTKGILLFWMGYLLWLFLMIYSPYWNLPSILDFFWPSSGLGHWMYSHVPRKMQFWVLYLLPFLSWLFALGIGDWIRVTKFQRCIDHLGLKTPTGLTPLVTKVIPMENRQMKILVHSIGIDVASFKDKKGVLESSLNAIVQDIRVSESNRQIFEILIAEKEIPKLIEFQEATSFLKKPYTFLVGQAMDNFIVADLCELHHMLVAGTTGGGKSVFFKQTLIGLLRSSKHIQLYLLDLKRGVEVKPFGALDNVEIAKDTVTAISTLKVVCSEMDRRFKYLEDKGFTEIVPERDRMDRIVVAIDEASVLFMIERSSKAAKVNATTARELTDKIAKLGRAAAIHVILATQKVVKETIDTRVQTNIHARMCFRMHNIADSMTVLGNRKAEQLPEIPGRGIWSVGSKDIVVQVPKLDNDGVISEVNALTSKFNGESSPLFQRMLDVSKKKTSRGDGFVEDSESSPAAERKAS